MPRKKKQDLGEVVPQKEAFVTDQPITETLRVNYMPYAMSVIISRAIPEIDGFKPSHRKLLYTMYKMGLLGGDRVKSTYVVGQTMQLNPHGDAAIYETMVRLTKGNEALLHPFIDSKGSFGKQYSDMAYAASRYTEVCLDSFCQTIFSGIDKDAVDFVDNYDGKQKEPTLLPTAFPNILVSPNVGIAVGMASNICSFNLGEICDAVCALIDNPDCDLTDILKAPDFSTGGYLLYDKDAMSQIYQTGRGSFRLRARYSYDKKHNCIEITEIPYTAKVEAVIDKIAALVKSGKIKEISDVRDETDLSGLKITIDLKRGIDPEKLMTRLFKLTPLEDSFACNFNVLIGGNPQTLGVNELLCEWIAWRSECVKREIYYNLVKMKEKLHLLYGLKELLLDIDKAIRIIRETKNEKDVIPNLMEGFSIDKLQAEYIAEIKLRNLNQEYILNKTSETQKLEKDIEANDELLKSDRKIKKLIARQQEEIKKKYALPRKTKLLYTEDAPVYTEPEYEAQEVEIVMTKDGYFKKVVPSKSHNAKIEEHKLKEGDQIILSQTCMSDCDLLFFSDKAQVYKAKIDDFDAVKPSALGEYIPAVLQFDEGEKFFGVCVTKDYKGYVAFVYQNGKALKVPLEAYATKTNRKKLTNAYSGDSPIVFVCQLTQKEDKKDPTELMLTSDGGKRIIFSAALLTEKVTRQSSGVYVFTMKKGQKIVDARLFADDGSEEMKEYSKFRKTKLPSTGTSVK